MLSSAGCWTTWFHCSSCATLPAVIIRRQINRDLLLTGAFLHDIGKVHELTFARSFTYTTRGQLLGHMIIELEMLHEKIAQVPGFPAEYKTLIEHLIISHHGKYEFGSPKMPMFPEALMLHYLDDLDSKMESMRAHFQREPEAEWTTYNASLERPLLNSKNFWKKYRPETAQQPGRELPQPAKLSQPDSRRQRLKKNSFLPATIISPDTRKCR